jgi:maltodextrin utilization protein YvdJ
MGLILAVLLLIVCAALWPVLIPLSLGLLSYGLLGLVTIFAVVGFIVAISAFFRNKKG